MKTILKNGIYFTSGIDTDAGKSYATGYLAKCLNDNGKRTITQKFIQTGNTGHSEDIDLHRKIMGTGYTPEDRDFLTMPEIFSYPASPLLASRIDKRKIDFDNVHFFIEANNKKDTELLIKTASLLSSHVFEASSEQRKYLHISAVFACNFTNHIYAICEHILNSHGLPFSAMLPLIDETAEKVHHLSPVLAQTGPAQRNDRNIMESHLDMLKDEPKTAELYKLISESIQNYKNNI